MLYKERKLILCGSSGGGGYDINPYVMIKGAWFRHCGFYCGDQVSVSNPEPGVLLMRNTLPRALVNLERKKKELELLLRQMNLHSAA